MSKRAGTCAVCAICAIRAGGAILASAGCGDNVPTDLGEVAGSRADGLGVTGVAVTLEAGASRQFALEGDAGFEIAVTQPGVAPGAQPALALALDPPHGSTQHVAATGEPTLDVAVAAGAGGTFTLEISNTGAVTAHAVLAVQPDEFVEAPHPPVPQVVPTNGDVLTAPNIVPVFFSGDDEESQLEAFLAGLPGSSYWHATTSEYGVGDVTVAPSIVSTDPPPTTTADQAAWFASRFDGTHPEWVFDANSIYALFFPAGVVLSDPGFVSCVDYGAYHETLPAAGSDVGVVAIIPRCDGLDRATLAASHELIEAATDPRLMGYATVDTAHDAWAEEIGAEVGDLCSLVAAASQPLVGTSVVQRTWSNASAAAGHDPCVPALALPYVAAVPALPETIHYGPDLTAGVTVPMGSSKIIEVDLYSDAPAAAWTVKAVDWASSQGRPPELTFAWDRTTGHNGDQLKLTITRVGAGSEQNASTFVVTSDLATAPMLYTQTHTGMAIDPTSVSMAWGVAAD